MKNISLALSAVRRYSRRMTEHLEQTEDVALDMEKAVHQAAKERAC